jgi:hypothetical protein
MELEVDGIRVDGRITLRYILNVVCSFGVDSLG